MSVAAPHSSADRPSGLPPVRPHTQAPARDPAFAGRVFWLGLALVLLWPLCVATEFRLWVLWEPENRKVTANFLRSFWPLVHNPEFLEMVVRETWRTVAMATAGVTLALVLAVPLSLLATRVLSLSALSGRMDRWPAVLRWCVRCLCVWWAWGPPRVCWPSR